MSFIPKPHEIYKHFKGNLYQITAVAEHSETGELLVIYQALYGDFKTYARPLNMFVSRVDREKYPDAEQKFRFELQGPDSARQRENPEAAAQGTQSDAARSGQPGMARETQSDAAQGGQPGMARETRSGMERENDAGREERGSAARETSPDGAGDAEREPAGEEPEEVTLDPMVLEFLDADNYEERLNILAGLHHRITNEMITTMAIVCDIEINDGDVEERYESLRNCLLTLERYECNRLR